MTKKHDKITQLGQVLKLFSSSFKNPCLLYFTDYNKKK